MVCGVVWCDVVWCVARSAVWCGVVWCDVLHVCGMMWCGVVWYYCIRILLTYHRVAIPQVNLEVR